MPVIADWAKGTIINGVSTAYNNFLIPNVDFEKNVTEQISGFSYKGLSNFSGGSLLQCIFITAIFMYMIDRKFIRAIIWSSLAALVSFFGLIHSPSVGVLYRSNDIGWKFTVAYAMLVVLFGLMEIAQRMNWIDQSELEPDDLSSEEWLEWNSRKTLSQQEHSIKL